MGFNSAFKGLKKFTTALRECSAAMVVQNPFGAAVCTSGPTEGSAVQITATGDNWSLITHAKLFIQIQLGTERYAPSTSDKADPNQHALNMYEVSDSQYSYQHVSTDITAFFRVMFLLQGYKSNCVTITL